MANIVRICKWEVRVNSLWLWWYCALVVISEGYLMYRAVSKCREYNELPWRSAEKPVMELYVYIGMIVISIMCIPFFIITSIFKVGNHANDGLRFGRDDIRNNCDIVLGGENAPPEETAEKVGKLQSTWRHVGPLCNTFHVAAAFTLLLPRTLLEAREIQHGFLTPDYVWRTELDVVFGKHFLHTATLTAGQPRNFTTPVPSGGQAPHSHVVPTSPEFINYMFALIIYSIRYGAVFWYTKMTFSLVFSFHLIIATCHYVFSFCTLAVLYKMQINQVVILGVQLVLPPSAVVLLHFLASLCMFVSAIAIFNYGCMHYEEALRLFIRRFRRGSRKRGPPPTGCQGYVPHTIATVSLVLVVACRGTLVYDCVTIYRSTGNDVMLAGIIWDVCFMVMWIIMWFVFTLKQSWNFRVAADFVHFEVPAPTSVYTIHNDHMTVESPAVASKPLNNSLSIPSDTTEVDPGNGKSPPASPSSAMRKSGRKLNNRVTFGGVSQHNDSGVVDEPSVGSGNSPRRRSRDRNSPNRKRKRKQERVPPDPDNPQPPPYDDADSSRRQDNDRPKQETPENTLTRNYRHSIRDKCGQYYRNSREFSSPPAAQSSPVLRKKVENREAPNVRSPEAAENIANDTRQIGFARPKSEERPSRFDTPSRPSGGAQQRRTSSAERVPHKHALANDPLRYNALIDYPQHNPPVHHRQRTPKANASQNPPSRPAPGRPQSKAQRDLNRELQIVVSNKPDMGRRDSALPSSNETSSNDSNDNVLCSQV